VIRPGLSTRVTALCGVRPATPRRRSMADSQPLRDAARRAITRRVPSVATARDAISRTSSRQCNRSRPACSSAYRRRSRPGHCRSRMDATNSCVARSATVRTWPGRSRERARRVMPTITMRLVSVRPVISRHDKRTPEPFMRRGVGAPVVTIAKRRLPHRRRARCALPVMWNRRPTSLAATARPVT
jgi:hypothetical protein